MKDFIKEFLAMELGDNYQEYYDKSSLLQYLDYKMGAIYGNSKSRRSFANIYAVYSILHFYKNSFYQKADEYKKFNGFDYTTLFNFYRNLYGGQKLQNHALNSRVNGEFQNKIKNTQNPLIIINNGKYLLHIDYLYVLNKDISLLAIGIIEKYIKLLQEKDTLLSKSLEILLTLESVEEKKDQLKSLIEENTEARIFEIISYAVLKHHYKNICIYIGYDIENLEQQYLTLYKTGRTNANDGGIDFVMRPLGRFYQVTEVGNYSKFTLDMDKVMHFPITFVIKTKKNKTEIYKEILQYIEEKSGGMDIIKQRYISAVEEIITINELKEWLLALDSRSINDLIKDIDFYYKMELHLEIDDSSDSIE